MNRGLRSIRCYLVFSVLLFMIGFILYLLLKPGEKVPERAIFVDINRLMQSKSIT